MRYKYAVLGAGALGLTTALRLLQHGNCVTVSQIPHAWKGRCLGLYSTATLFSLTEEQLWLHGTTHHGPLPNEEDTGPSDNRPDPSHTGNSIPEQGRRSPTALVAIQPAFAAFLEAEVTAK